MRRHLTYLRGGRFIIALALLGGALGGTAASAGTPNLENAVSFKIAPQALSAALLKYSEQSGIQVTSASDLLAGLTSIGVAGTLPAANALTRLLEGTRLSYEVIDERTVTIRSTSKPSAGHSDAAPAGANLGARDHAESAPVRLAEVELQRVKSPALANERQTAARDAEKADNKGIPEMLVKGQRTSNTDIRRTENDVQPYVVFEAEEIERSMASDLESFLKTRLPMNQTGETEGQKATFSASSFRGNQSTVNLRGLGANQTLILVNGRRRPSVPDRAAFHQPDINGIPLSAVERIEILPSTAGGIYGGGATGGVVNVILKRSYSGMEIRAAYDGTFDGGGAQRTLEVNGGFSLFGGRTNVMVMASHHSANPLYVGDRNFAELGRKLQKRNNADAFLQSPPPYGYTTNIASTDGQDLVLASSGQSLGEPIAFVPVGYLGPDSDNGVAFLATAGQYNLDLSNDTVGLRETLVSVPTVRSAALSIRHELAKRVEVFLDASRDENIGVGDSQLPVNRILMPGPNSPFTEPVELTIPFVNMPNRVSQVSSKSETSQITGGAILRFQGDWTMHAEYTWSRSRSGSAYSATLFTVDGEAALLDGRLDPLRDVNAYPLDLSPYYFYPDKDTFVNDFNTILEDATLRVAGPILHLAGGPVTLSAMLESREENTKESIAFAYLPNNPDEPVFGYYPPLGSTTNSIYAEVNVPFVSQSNPKPGIRELDLQASYRLDDTETRTRPIPTGPTDPIPSRDGPFPDVPNEINTVRANQFTFGLRYKPVNSLALRVSYGEGILPPSVDQLAESQLNPNFVRFFGLRDPKRGGVLITDIDRYSFLGSLDLREEQSSSWSAGIIMTPDFLPGFRLSLDYTRIRKKDEITRARAQFIIDLEDEAFPNRITRDPLTPADELLGYTGGPITELDVGIVNLARSTLEAYDVNADYSWDTAIGSFTASVLMSYQPHLIQLPVENNDEIEQVGHTGGPLKLRGNAGLVWDRGPWSLGWNMQHYASYFVYSAASSPLVRDLIIDDQGAPLIPSQTFHDLSGRYRFEGLSGSRLTFLNNTELMVAIQNVLNDSPPILATTAPGRGGYSTYGDPRLRRYSISLRKTF